MGTPVVYILAARRNGTLYVGLSTSINRRIRQHREGVADSFTFRHGVTRLVYFERHPNLVEARHRERRLKRWRRQWKIELIENVNPGWHDLSGQLLTG